MKIPVAVFCRSGQGFMGSHGKRFLDMKWYAYRVFHNKRKFIVSVAEKAGCKVFVQDVIPSLLFIRSSCEFMLGLRKENQDHLGVYFRPGTCEPAVILDKDMEMFMFVVSTGCRTLETVDEKLVKGDKVQVTEGLFKGTEGYITRIHGTKRFVVLLEGIAAVSTTYIPRAHLRRISPQDNG